MQDASAAETPSTRWNRRIDVRKLLRFGASSIVAVVCSETTFLLLYGLVHTSSTVASTSAWIAGAIRTSSSTARTFGRRGKLSLTRELAPYLAIVLGTLGLAIAATAIGDALLRNSGVSHGTRTFILGGTPYRCTR